MAQKTTTVELVKKKDCKGSVCFENKDNLAAVSSLYVNRSFAEINGANKIKVMVAGKETPKVGCLGIPYTEVGAVMQELAEVIIARLGVNGETEEQPAEGIQPQTYTVVTRCLCGCDDYPIYHIRAASANQAGQLVRQTDGVTERGVEIIAVFPGRLSDAYDKSKEV